MKRKTTKGKDKELSRIRSAPVRHITTMEGKPETFEELQSQLLCTYPLPVSDFLMWDRVIGSPSSVRFAPFVNPLTGIKYERGKVVQPPRTDWLWWLLRCLVIQQGTRCVIVPEELVAHTRWGQRRLWPGDWRRDMRRFLDSCGVERIDSLGESCGERCPWHHRQKIGHAHGHIEVTLHEEQMGILQRCVVLSRPKPDWGTPASCQPVINARHVELSGAGTPLARYNFARVGKARRKKGRRSPEERELTKGVYSVYLPFALFGRAAGLKLREVRLMCSILKELTRERKSVKSQRKDRARLDCRSPGLPNLMCVDRKTNEFMPLYWLPCNGNQKKAHLGRISLRERAIRSHHWRKNSFSLDRRLLVYLHDLKKLSLELDFHAHVISSEGLGRVVSLDEACLDVLKYADDDLLVWVPENYQERWRAWLSLKLGMAITSNADKVQHAPRTESELYLSMLRTDMETRGLTYRDAAVELGVSPVTMGHVLRGERKPYAKLLIAMIKKYGGRSVQQARS